MHDYLTLQHLLIFTSFFCLRSGNGMVLLKNGLYDLVNLHSAGSGKLAASKYKFPLLSKEMTFQGIHFRLCRSN